MLTDFLHFFAVYFKNIRLKYKNENKVKHTVKNPKPSLCLQTFQKISLNFFSQLNKRICPSHSDPGFGNPLLCSCASAMLKLIYRLLLLVILSAHEVSRLSHGFSFPTKLPSLFSNAGPFPLIPYINNMLLSFLTGSNFK